LVTWRLSSNVVRRTISTGLVHLLDFPA